MSKLIPLVAVVFVFVAFTAGYKTHEYRNPRPTYALQPDDCKYRGMTATGWETQEKYRGGINNGGASGPIMYECH